MPADTARFSGYGLLSLPLESGDVFAFRRCVLSSLGPPFNCLWHREPAGCWVLHVDVAPGRSPAPFFAPAVAEVRVGEIAVEWRGRLDVSIAVCAARISLALRLAATPRTCLLGAAAALVPSPLWRRPPLLRAMGRAAALGLDAAPLQLTGRTAGGQDYRMRPAGAWHVAGAVAVLAGRDLGALVLAPEPPLLGGLPLPRRALLAALTEEYTLAAVALPA